MKTKRPTKAQRDAAQKAALLRRVTDVYSGALGAEWGEDEWATAEILASVIPALRDIFGEQAGRDYMWECHCIDRFDTAKTATDFLFEAGIRA